MELFYDKQMKNPIEDTIDMGKVEAGSEGYLSIWLYNDDDKAVLENISIDFNEESIEILEVPKQILPKSVGELRLVWEPPMNKREALEIQVNIRADEVFYAKSRVEEMSKSPILIPVETIRLEHKIHCDLCGLDWDERQYYAHLKLHSKEDLESERKRTKSELRDGI